MSALLRVGGRRGSLPGLPFHTVPPANCLRGNHDRTQFLFEYWSILFICIIIGYTHGTYFRVQLRTLMHGMPWFRASSARIASTRADVVQIMTRGQASKPPPSWSLRSGVWPAMANPRRRASRRTPFGIPVWSPGLQDAPGGTTSGCRATTLDLPLTCGRRLSDENISGFSTDKRALHSPSEVPGSWEISTIIIYTHNTGRRAPKLAFDPP